VTLTLPDPEPGTVVRDTVEVIERLPTGEPETLPCIVMNGAEDGPTLWVTGSIHGNEVTGLAVCQDIVHDDLGAFPEPVEPPLSGQVHRYVGPHAPPTAAGIIRHEVAAGDVVEAGDVVARIVPPNGDPEREIELTIDHDGWVTHRHPGVPAYENSPIASLAIEDDHDVVGTPEDDG